jgi:hypothetical protein
MQRQGNAAAIVAMPTTIPVRLRWYISGRRWSSCEAFLQAIADHGELAGFANANGHSVQASLAFDLFEAHAAHALVCHPDDKLSSWSLLFRATRGHYSRLYGSL